MHTEGLRADMADGALAAEDESPPPTRPQPRAFAHPKDPPELASSPLHDQLDAISLKKGWHEMPNDDWALVCWNSKEFRTSLPKLDLAHYPYRSTYVGFTGCWLVYEDHVQYMTIPERVRKGPLTSKKSRLIHIFHKAAASGGGVEAEAPLQIRNGEPPNDASAIVKKDVWEIREDRVVRVCNEPRLETTIPTTEPEPCPIPNEHLTPKRVTVIRPVDAINELDHRTVVDQWKHSELSLIHI